MKYFALVLLSLWSLVTSAKDYPDFSDLYEKQGAAVVNISITQIRNGINFSDNERIQEFFRQFGFPAPLGIPETPQEYKTQSLGSGFIISSDGYLLTNAHVVNEADEILVRLVDKREFKAKLIGADARTDIALLKIDASNLPKVTIGDANKLKVGEWVAAIGSPFGLENTMTVGIVSAKGRALPQENYVPFIQTDAAVNPGNSGGPLFNLAGEVVGINSQIYSQTGGSVGLSFAIPIDVAIDVSTQLKTYGKINRGWLGIAIQEVNKDLAESFGLKSTGGALIAGIEKNSPADKSGLEVGDVIVKFDGKTLASSTELPRLVATTKPGRVVAVEVIRKGNRKVINASIGELVNTQAMPYKQQREQSYQPKYNKLGLAVVDLTPQQKRQLGKNGVFVLDTRGSSRQVGLRRGDVILALNDAEVISVEQFNKLLRATSGSVALLVQRGENVNYIAIKPNK